MWAALVLGLIAVVFAAAVAWAVAEAAAFAALVAEGAWFTTRVAESTWLTLFAIVADKTVGAEDGLLAVWLERNFAVVTALGASSAVHSDRAAVLATWGKPGLTAWFIAWFATWLVSSLAATELFAEHIFAKIRLEFANHTLVSQK